ncbi:MAG: CoA transferase [Chloroflexi bacterium]|nr:CoA transferase [Chloroflexota bacterium]
MPDPSLNPPSAATGLRVVELGDPKVGYAAKLFGDMGADVIKIEPLGGEASRRIGPFVDDIPDANKSLFFWHYNTSKRGVTLELDKAEGRALFRRLVDSADILLDGEKPGRLAALELGYETLEAANPKLIACSVTPFGQDGPWRDLLASDLIHMALGGQMASTGPDDPTGQPIAGTGYQSLHVGGNFAAIAILTALVERDASGRGQYIDISIHDACATCTEIAIPSWIYTKQGVYRQIGRHAMVARDSRQNFRAADGKWVNTILPMISTPQWHALVQWMGQHEGGGGVRAVHRDVSERLDLPPGTAAAPLVGTDPRTGGEPRGPRAHRARVLARGGAPGDRAHDSLSGRADRLAGDAVAHLASRAAAGGAQLRGVWQGVGADGRGVDGAGRDGGDMSSANGKGPLSGIRVIDFTWWVVGPQATRFLAAFGADVIMIERPDAWVAFRQASYQGKTGPNYGTMFNHINPMKRSLTLNLRHPKGYGIITRLISKADVVIENFSSRVMESWGLTYEEMKKVKPDIIYVSMSGLGHKGMYSDYVTFGPTAQALSGLTHTSGQPGDQPQGWGFSYMDHVGGYIAAMGVLFALHYRNRTGKGQYIDQAIVESAITQMGPYVLDYQVNGRGTRRPDFPPGNHASHPRVAPHNAYRCQGKDNVGQDQWCAIACFDDAQFASLCKAMGRPEMASDPRFATNLASLQHECELDEAVGAWTASRDKFNVMYALQSQGVTAGAVQTAQDRLERDNHLRERGLFVELEHAALGKHLMETLPMQLSRTPHEFTRPGPLCGEHNEAVLTELLQMTPEDIKGLREEGVI